jgi:DNA-binding NarL/FixJ family response regulator
MSADSVKRHVLIAEDQRGMRGLVHQLLDQEDDFEVVAEATTGQEVLELAASKDPDVVVLDLGLPVLDGEAVLEELRATRPGTRIVVLSGQASAIIQPRLLDHGADAVVEKGAAHWEGALVAEVRRRK